MKSLFRITLIIVTALALLGYYLIQSDDPKEIEFIGKIFDKTLSVDGMQRQYKVLVPDSVAQHPAVLFALHGSTQDIEKYRRFSGYTFEQLAMQQGLILVYPQGYKNNWNDCRATASYPAKAENIDDVSFIQAINQQLAKQYSIDEYRRYLSGFSNGGHFGFRLALEHPDMFTGIAAISANLPSGDNLDCTASGKASSIILLNGTDDPINPFDGGQVTLFGFGDRGQVESSIETAQYFAQLAGYTQPSDTAQ